MKTQPQPQPYPQPHPQKQPQLQISSQTPGPVLSTQSTQDLPPSRLRVNADDEGLMDIWMPRMILLIVVVMIFVLRLAVPSTFKTYTNQIAFQGNQASKNCNPTGIDASKKIYCEDYTSANPEKGLLIRGIKAENQFIVFYFEFMILDSLVESAELNQAVQVQAHEVVEVTYNQQNKRQLFLRKLIYNESTNYHYSFKSLKPQPLQISNQPYSRYSIAFAYDRISTPTATAPKSFTLNLLLITKFSNPSQIAPISSSLQLEAITLNPDFTIFTIVVRGVYFGLSLISCVVFLVRYCQVQMRFRGVQRRFVAVVGVMLVLFNDPLYAVTVLKINPVTTFFSVFWTVNLFIALIALWTFFLKNMYVKYNPQPSPQPSSQSQSQSQPSSPSSPPSPKPTILSPKKSWPTYLTLLALYSTILAFFLQYSYYIYKKIPIIVPQDLTQMKVMPTIVIMAVILAAVIFYQIGMMVLVVYRYWWREGRMEQRDRSYLGVYLGGLAAFLGFFGVGAAMPYSYDGTWILYGYSFMNIFVYMLQYLYYTPASQLQKQRIHPQQPHQQQNSQAPLNQDSQINPSTKHQKQQQQLQQQSQQQSQPRQRKKIRSENHVIEEHGQY